mgnify:CR=1 FL=1
MQDVPASARDRRCLLHPSGAGRTYALRCCGHRLVVARRGAVTGSMGPHRCRRLPRRHGDHRARAEVIRQALAVLALLIVL